MLSKSGLDLKENFGRPMDMNKSILSIIYWVMHESVPA